MWSPRRVQAARLLSESTLMGGSKVSKGICTSENVCQRESEQQRALMLLLGQNMSSSNTSAVARLSARPAHLAAVCAGRV